MIFQFFKVREPSGRKKKKQKIRKKQGVGQSYFRIFLFLPAMRRRDMGNYCQQSRKSDHVSRSHAATLDDLEKQLDDLERKFGMSKKSEVALNGDSEPTCSSCSAKPAAPAPSCEVKLHGDGDVLVLPQSDVSRFFDTYSGITGSSVAAADARAWFVFVVGFLQRLTIQSKYLFMVQNSMEVISENERKRKTVNSYGNGVGEKRGRTVDELDSDESPPSQINRPNDDASSAINEAVVTPSRYRWSNTEYDALLMSSAKPTYPKIKTMLKNNKNHFEEKFFDVLEDFIYMVSGTDNIVLFERTYPNTFAFLKSLRKNEQYEREKTKYETLLPAMLYHIARIHLLSPAEKGLWEKTQELVRKNFAYLEKSTEDVLNEGTRNKMIEVAIASSLTHCNTGITVVSPEIKHLGFSALRGSLESSRTLSGNTELDRSLAAYISDSMKTMYDTVPTSFNSANIPFKLFKATENQNGSYKLLGKSLIEIVDNSRIKTPSMPGLGEIRLLEYDGKYYVTRWNIIARADVPLENSVSQMYQAWLLGMRSLTSSDFHDGYIPVAGIDFRKNTGEKDTISAAMAAREQGKRDIFDAFALLRWWYFHGGPGSLVSWNTLSEDEQKKNQKILNLFTGLFDTLTDIVKTKTKNIVEETARIQEKIQEIEELENEIKKAVAPQSDRRMDDDDGFKTDDDETTPPASPIRSSGQGGASQSDDRMIDIETPASPIPPHIQPNVGARQDGDRMRDMVLPTSPISEQDQTSAVETIEIPSQNVEQTPRSEIIYPTFWGSVWQCTVRGAKKLTARYVLQALHGADDYYIDANGNIRFIRYSRPPAQTGQDTATSNANQTPQETALLPVSPSRRTDERPQEQPVQQRSVSLSDAVVAANDRRIESLPKFKDYIILMEESLFGNKADGAGSILIEVLQERMRKKTVVSHTLWTKFEEKLKEKPQMAAMVGVSGGGWREWVPQCLRLR